MIDNGGALDGEMRQRLRGGGRDGSERRAHGVEEEAQRRNDPSPAISGAQSRWQRTHCPNPSRVQMNKQGTTSQSKTEQTEQQDPAQIELKPSKYLALLVALFPHCLIPPRPQQWKNPRPSLPLLGPQTRQGAPSAERILKSRTNFSSRQDSDPGSRKSWTESTDCRV